MPELRKNYLGDKWIVFAPERAKRPSSFTKTDEYKVVHCPFCPGNEHMCPPEIMRYEKDGKWILRSIFNKFPLFEGKGEFSKKEKESFISAKAIGQHEVIIESRKHSSFNIGHRSNEELSTVIKSYVDRYKELSKREEVKYVFIYKNHKGEGGASVTHPHSQVIAMPIIPPRVRSELEISKKYYEKNNISPYAAIAIRERKSKRFVYENETFMLFTPFASLRPYQMFILPKKKVKSFLDFDDKLIDDLSDILNKVLHTNYQIMEDPPFNYYFHHWPCDGNEYPYYSFHVEIFPKLTTRGGLEKGAGMYANTLPPEEGAKILRHYITVEWE